MENPTKTPSLIIPSLTVFITSFCIMVVELVAGRLISRFLGSSLYTWTSVIGVVLTGITIGNYVGGRVADRFSSRKSLAWLFALSAGSCVAIIVMNNLVGSWIWLYKLNWPLRVFTHVCIVFLLPSAMLGTVSPVVTKIALDKGLPTGRTVGDIYAWGAAGSIAGTFSAGYFLIAELGSIAIIWSVAGLLVLMAMAYTVRRSFGYAIGALFICILVTGAGPWQWAQQTAAAVSLRKPAQKDIIFEDETPYCYVAVKQLSSNPDRRIFMQDRLKHSEILMNDVLDLQYFYSHIFAAVTSALTADKDDLAVLTIGGGGYVFPRYLQKRWPQSRIDVVEIDPGVTEAAIKAFGLARNSSINTFTMDARNYLDSLLQQEAAGGRKTRYNFIYGDAINAYSVPYQLTTFEFNEKIAQLLDEDGVYMVELIDTFESGLFLGAMITTLEKSFQYVDVVTRGDLPKASRNVFVVIASNKILDIDRYCENYKKKSQNLWHLNKSQIQTLKQKSNQLVLTDDYAPVENLLSPVVRAVAMDNLADEYTKQAADLLAQGRFDEYIKMCRRIIDISPILSVKIYNEMGIAFSNQQKWSDAEEAFRNSINYIVQQNLMLNTANTRFNLAGVLQKSGKTNQAQQQYRLAADEYRREILADPQSYKNHSLLAKSLASIGDFEQAEKHFLQAVNLYPFDADTHLALAHVLQFQGKSKEAIDYLRSKIAFMSNLGQIESTRTLQKYLQTMESKIPEKITE